MNLTDRLAIAMMAALFGFCSMASGAEPKVLAKGLDNPAGVAVQPGTGDVFVSGNKAIHRLVKSKGYEASPAVTDFPTDVYGKGPKYNIGALGLLFADANTLVAGGGDRVDGEEVVYFFEVGPKPTTQKAADAKATSGPITGTGEYKGEGNFYALAQVGDEIFVTCNGDDTKGWISKITLKDGKPGDLTPFIATKPLVNVDAPTGIAATKDGKLVVSQMGEINAPADSLLTVYDPKTGKLVSNKKTGINDIIALAYSPKTGKLYGVDFSWLDTTKGALLEIVADSEEVATKKVADLDKPTAIAFDKDGNAFVSVIGSPDNGGGKVLMFTGL